MESQKDNDTINGFIVEALEDMEAKTIYLRLESNIFKIDFLNPTSLKKGERFSLTKTELDSAKAEYITLISFRGRLINRAVDIERELDDLLSMIFIPPKKWESKFEGKGKGEVTLNLGTDVKRIDFVKRLFVPNYVSFMNKFKIFRDLSEREVHSLLQNYSKERLEHIRKLLYKVINARDDFAHGRILFYGSTPHLQFFRDGTHEPELTQAYLDEQMKNFDTCFAELGELINHLEKNATELL